MANCRSVVKKLESVGDYFENEGHLFGILTETWVSESNEIKLREDFSELYGLDFIVKNRRGRGGGVGIVSKRNEINFKEHAFYAGSYEAVCARATLVAEKKLLNVFACYYPPSMKQVDVDGMNELIMDEILRIQSNEKETPYIIIAGDMNLKNVDCFLNIAGINLINTGPTRKDAHLDLCYTNCKIVDTNVHIPLWSFEGVDSDHRVVSYVAQFTKKKFEYTKTRSRKCTKKGEEDFCRLITDTDWAEMDSIPLVDKKTEWLHGKIESYMNICFPMKTRKIRSDEDPWITDHIRDRIKIRNDTFRFDGRGRRWKAMKNEVREKIALSRKAYYDREIEKIRNASDKRSLAYTALKNLNCSARPKQWSICHLDNEKEEIQIAEEIADYFNNVNSEYDIVLKEKVPTTYDRPIYNLSNEMIVKRIKDSKKPNSIVPGDLPPKLLNRLAETIAIPAGKIFNCVPLQKWPALWKLEYQTIIPKKPNPQGFAELRNLSCTNFLSKVLESFVIDSIRSEIELSELQYGGLKGCGTDNFLVEVWNNILETLDEKERAISIMSVDFSKAFNRLDHQACLDKMAEKSASNQTLSMVFSFLSKREMCVKSGDRFTNTRQVQGGSPQGTKLGNLLFCIAIDDITVPENGNETEKISPAQDPISPISAIPDHYRPTVTSTPALDDSFNANPYGIRRKKRVVNDTTNFSMLSEEEYNDVDTWEVGYIDDINVGEPLKMENVISTFSTRKELKEIRSKGCEVAFTVIQTNGKKVGMQINPLKTQLICISSNNFADVKRRTLNLLDTKGLKLLDTWGLKLLDTEGLKLLDTFSGGLKLLDTRGLKLLDIFSEGLKLLDTFFEEPQFVRHQGLKLLDTF